MVSGRVVALLPRHPRPAVVSITVQYHQCMKRMILIKKDIPLTTMNATVASIVVVVVVEVGVGV